MIYEDTLNQLHRIQLENEKLDRKLNVVTKEYQTLQADMSKKILELELLNQAEITRRVAEKSAERAGADSSTSSATQQQERAGRTLCFVFKCVYSIILIVLVEFVATAINPTAIVNLKRELHDSKLQIDRLKTEVSKFPDINVKILLMSLNSYAFWRNCWERPGSLIKH